MKKHHDDGPSLSQKPPTRRPSVNTTMHPSPARQQTTLQQTARDAAKQREMHKKLKNGDLAKEIAKQIMAGAIDVSRL